MTRRTLAGIARGFDAVWMATGGDGIIDDTPAARSMGRKLGLVRSRRQRQEDKHPFTEENRDLFHKWAATADTRLADRFFTLERAGLRLGERLALRLGDVNLKRRELRIERSVSAFDRSTKAPKSGHGRTVEIGEQLAAVLVGVTARRRREGLKAGELNPLMFPSEAGTPYHHGNVEKQFKRVLKAAGLPDHHTPHDLRHTYATLLLERGVDMNGLKDQLGHASIQMTWDEYGRWAKARKGLARLLDRPRRRLVLPMRAVCCQKGDRRRLGTARRSRTPRTASSGTVRTSVPPGRDRKLVRPGRFERPTYRFVVCCSIQLS